MENAKKIGKIIAQAWLDQEFLARLKAEPHAVLREHGLDVPANQQVEVCVDSPSKIHVVIPNRPADLNDAQLTRSGIHTEATKIAC